MSEQCCGQWRWRVLEGVELSEIQLGKTLRFVVVAMHETWCERKNPSSREINVKVETEPDLREFGRVYFVGVSALGAGTIKTRVWYEPGEDHKGHVSLGNWCAGYGT